MPELHFTTLQDLLDHRDAFNKATVAFWDSQIAPRLAPCQTRKEVMRVLTAVHLEAHGPDGSMRNLPSELVNRMVEAVLRYPADPSVASE